MKKLLLILGLSLGFIGTQASAEFKVFEGEYEDNPSFNECMKAAQKGNYIGRNGKTSYIAYNNKIYLINADGPYMTCAIVSNYEEFK